MVTSHSSHLKLSSYYSRTQLTFVTFFVYLLWNHSFHKANGINCVSANFINWVNLLGIKTIKLPTILRPFPQYFKLIKKLLKGNDTQCLCWFKLLIFCLYLNEQRGRYKLLRSLCGTVGMRNVMGPCISICSGSLFLVHTARWIGKLLKRSRSQFY